MMRILTKGLLVALAMMPAVTSAQTAILNGATITDPATAAISAKLPIAASGTDHSANAPALLANLLSTLPVVNPGAYYVSNPSGAPVQLVLCPTGTTLPTTTAAAAAANCTVDPLAAGGSVGAAGQNTAPPITWFVEVVFVLGGSSTQYVAGRSN